LDVTPNTATTAKPFEPTIPFKYNVVKKGVLLEIGHGAYPGGFEPGAVHKSGATEYDLNVIVATTAKDALKRRGIACELTDSPKSLYMIGHEAADYDVFVSIHHNAFNAEAQGTEAFYHSTRGNGNDRELAEIVAEKIADKLRIPNRGAKSANFGVLAGAEAVHESTDAAILAEIYFMDAPEASYLPELSLKGGEALAEGIAEYLELT
jgi:N-acetylmuramoyl-L-alanine amidase